ncbi:MAG: DNA lyase [Elusimicrobiota bacterium]
MNIIELKRLYRLRKGEIISRLNEFGCVLRKGARKSAQKDIFPELCFCLFTPQSKAKSCWEAVSILKNNKLLFSGEAQQISEHLNKVRFKNNKARYVTESRKIMGELHKRLLDPKEQANTFELRNWIVKNIKGIGYKEASHFLRNIGLGENLAILDRHILKNMKALGGYKRNSNINYAEKIF